MILTILWILVGITIIGTFTYLIWEKNVRNKNIIYYVDRVNNIGWQIILLIIIITGLIIISIQKTHNTPIPFISKYEELSEIKLKYIKLHLKLINIIEIKLDELSNINN